MKKLFLSVIGAFSAIAVLGEGTAAYDEASQTLTLDGLVTNVTAEADLGPATNVVLRNGGGVIFGSTFTQDGKVYSIAGDGLSATGVIGVATGFQVDFNTKENLCLGTRGHVFVKRGGGILRIGNGPGVVNTPTRWIIEEGLFLAGGADFFGNHKSTTTNVTLEVRAGGRYQTEGSHCPIGPLVLVGGKANFRSGDSSVSDWGASALRGGVVAKACETESTIAISGFLHLNHEYVDVPFVVEEGAVLNVGGTLANGWNTAYTARMDNRMVVSGGGVLRLYGSNEFSGGVKICDGTTLVAGNVLALGTSKTLEIDGDVTLDVAAGVTLGNFTVTGSGTLTKTGAGVLTTASVAESVTIVRAEGEGTDGSFVKDGVLRVNGGSITLNVEAGEVLEVTSITAEVPEFGKLTDLVKVGAGTLVLPAADNSALFRNLKVCDGAVQIAAENNLGSGNVTLRSGGQLAFSSSFTFNTWQHRVTVEGEGGFNVAEDVAVGVYSNNLHVANSTFHKVGAGSLEFREDGFFRAADVGEKAVLIADGGTLVFNKDPFCGHSGNPGQRIEVNAGATVLLNAHAPVGTVILRGGTIKTKQSPAYLSAGNTVVTNLEDCLTRWDCSLSCNSTLEVHPSPDGTPSVIRAHRMFFAHGNHSVHIDVEDGAVLRLEGGRLDNGRDSAGTASVETGFTKRGAGELVLDLNVGLTGQILVEDGVLTMGPNGRLPSASRVQVVPGATLRLADKSVFGARMETADPFLATADIWMDATRLPSRPGESIHRVPNLGTARGAFVKFTKGTIPGVPVYTANAINGLPALHFNGGQALSLNSYTNTSKTLTVFMVADWTSWDYNGGSGGKGHWGGGLSMSSVTATSTDNGVRSSFHTETATSINNTYVNSGLGTVTIANANRGVLTPYLDDISYTGTRFEVRQYVGPGVDEVISSAAQSTADSLNIDVVALGGRLDAAGRCQYFGSTSGSNRMYIGYIGELLVFTRVLSADEQALVRAYLKRKWFGDTAVEGPADAVTSSAANAVVDVPAEAEGGLAGSWTVESEQGGAVAFSKTGSGTLNLRAQMSGKGVVDVAAGTMELSSGTLTSRADVWLDAADAETVAIEDGKAVSVVNKGRTGGVFGPCKGRYNTAVPSPTYEDAGLQGRGAVCFDWNAGLSLNTYTNIAAQRSLNIYMVAQRTKYSEAGGKGKWGGPFSFIGTSATMDDQGVTGASHLEETLTNRVTVFTGNSSTANTLREGGLTEPYLFVCHQSSIGSTYAYEWADTPVDQVTLYKGGVLSSIDVDRVILGGRGTTGGVMQWQSKDNGNNRTWAGRIGELIVFTSPLCVAAETELLAYLRAKWLGKGEASATPPAWLSGDYGIPTLNGLGLKAESGTSIVQAGPTVALTSLEAANDVAWTRSGTSNETAYALFDVTGEMSFGAGQSLHMDPAPAHTAKLFGGTVTGDSTKWTFTGDHSNAVGISRRADGLYLLRGLGTVIYFR